MTTRKLIEQLPEKIVGRIESYRKDYSNSALKSDEVRARIAGYCQGLRDGGVLTESERRTLFVYSTTRFVMQEESDID